MSCLEAEKVRGSKTLVITMTNDLIRNKIKVYDAASRRLLQVLDTEGKGGVAGNAGGIKQYKNKLVAVVNNGSNSVSIFKRRDKELYLKKVICTSTGPVSIVFGRGHMYVVCIDTIHSISLSDFKHDGCASLVLAGGITPVAGNTSQVGYTGDKVLVTLKNDPSPGTVDVVTLSRTGKIKSVTPVAAPANTLTPFGFSTLEDGTALITLAHSNNLGLFRDDAFVAVVTLNQAAPCWTARNGKYIFTINTGSRTISRLVTSGSNIFVDSDTAATISDGNPTDAAINGNIMAVLDHNATSSVLNFFSINVFGELVALGTVDVLTPNANGVAVMI